LRGAGLHGGQGGNRTPDTGIFNPLLYQLSYLAEMMKVALGAGPCSTAPGAAKRAIKAGPCQIVKPPRDNVSFMRASARRCEDPVCVARPLEARALK
jgi:hypothetical protein